jgi:hypothetical protein
VTINAAPDSFVPREKGEAARDKNEWPVEVNQYILCKVYFFMQTLIIGKRFLRPAPLPHEPLFSKCRLSSFSLSGISCNQKGRADHAEP